MSSTTSKINDLSWMTGGPQGSGVDSSANIFARACVLGGLWAFGLREYYSSIKGPHSYFGVRINKDKIRSHVNDVNLLATFDAETLIRHAEEVAPGGGILYDPTLGNVEIDKVEPIETRLFYGSKQDSRNKVSPETSAAFWKRRKREASTSILFPTTILLQRWLRRSGSISSAKFLELSTFSL